MDAHQRRTFRRLLAKLQPSDSTQKHANIDHISSDIKQGETHHGEIFLAGATLIVEALALTFSIAWLAWCGGGLCWLAIFLYTKKADRRVKISTRIVAAIALALTIVAITEGRHLWEKPTYVYFIPGRGLAENSANSPQEFIPRRAFVLMQQGSQILYNVNVFLRDNNAAADPRSRGTHAENYPEIDPDTAPEDVPQRYFWWSPSAPWNENYTITMTTRGDTFTERIVIKELNGIAYFAIRLTMNGRTKPLLTCLDPALVELAEWGGDAPHPCQAMLPDEPVFSGRLEPRPYVLFPNSHSMIDMSPPPPAISHPPETESDVRRLTEWQRAQLKLVLDRYPGHKVRILVSGGESTWRYARDFREVFAMSRWNVEGPTNAPKVQQPPLDVQISTGDEFGHARKEILDVRDAMKGAGIKGSKFFVYDPSLKKDVVLLWIGVRSPDEDRGPIMEHPPVVLP